MVTDDIFSRFSPVLINSIGNWLVPPTGRNRIFIDPSTIRMDSAESSFAKAPQAANTAAAIKTVLLMIIFAFFLLLSHYSPLAAKSYTTGAIIPHKTPNATDVPNFAAIVFNAKTIC
jgi:hypothetical protein